MILKLTRDLAINPAMVASIGWNRGHSYSDLVITMADGTRHVIRDGAGYSPDCYDIERRIIAAAAEAPKP